MINGYIILDLNAENVYNQALECAENGKPVLINFNGESFYADSVVVSGSDVIVTALNRTYTIDSTNQVVLTDTTPHLYQYLIKGTDENEDNLEFVVITTEDISSKTDIVEIFSKSLQYTPGSIDGEWQNPYVVYLHSGLVTMPYNNTAYELNGETFTISSITLLTQLF